MSKIYHTRIPNMTFVAQCYDKDGKPLSGQSKKVQFRGDSLETDDPEVIEQLDKIADTPNCPVYINNSRLVLPDANVPFNEVKERAAAVVAQIAAAGQRVE